MIYRTLPDLDPPAHADIETPDLARADAAIDLCEHYQIMLARIADVGMAMIEASALKVTADGGAGDIDAFCKASQAVRRTVALHIRLAREARDARDTVEAQRARRRADIARAHKIAKDEAILDGLNEAYAGSNTGADFDPDGDIIFGIADIDTERLGDADEFAGYVDRPVGDTVAKLCAVLGLDPAACVLTNGAWRVRQPPLAPLPPLPPPCGEGGSERSDETGGARRSDHDPSEIGEPHISGADPPASLPASALPHPDGFAVCPSP